MNCDENVWFDAKIPPTYLISMYEESGLFIVTYRHLYIKSIVVALDKAIITVFEMETST